MRNKSIIKLSRKIKIVNLMKSDSLNLACHGLENGGFEIYVLLNSEIVFIDAKCLLFFHLLRKFDDSLLSVQNGANGKKRFRQATNERLVFD